MGVGWRARLPGSARGARIEGTQNYAHDTHTHTHTYAHTHTHTCELHRPAWLGVGTTHTHSPAPSYETFDVCVCVCVYTSVTSGIRLCDLPVASVIPRQRTVRQCAPRVIHQPPGLGCLMYVVQCLLLCLCVGASCVLRVTVSCVTVRVDVPVPCVFTQIHEHVMLVFE